MHLDVISHGWVNTNIGAIYQMSYLILASFLLHRQRRQVKCCSSSLDIPHNASPWAATVGRSIAGGKASWLSFRKKFFTLQAFFRVVESNLVCLNQVSWG